MAYSFKFITKAISGSECDDHNEPSLFVESIELFK